MRKGQRGALAWISRFENAVNGTGRRLPEVLRRANMKWYEMSDAGTADIVTTMNPDRRLFFARFDVPSFINQRLIGLRVTRAYPDLFLNHALLNSLLGMFYVEAIGFGRGLGALDLNSRTLAKAYMLNPNLVGSERRKLIVDKFATLEKRDVYQTEVELIRSDRRAFDQVVLDTFGMGAYYDPITDALLSMQRMRLSVRLDEASS